MAKKETKKKEKKAAKQKDKTVQTVAIDPNAPAPAPNTTATGDPALAQTQDVAAAAAAANINSMALDRNAVTADQMTQAQIEAAIKESQDPSSKLKKLRSPLSVKGCLLNLVILLVVTIVIVYLWLYLFELDKDTFNILTVTKSILSEFGITQFFQRIGAWFAGIFS